MSQVPAIPGAVQPPAGNQVGGAQVVQNPPGHDQAGGGRQQQNNDGEIAAPQPEAAPVAAMQQAGGQPQVPAPPQDGGQPGVPRGGAGDQQAGIGLPPARQSNITPHQQTHPQRLVRRPVLLGADSTCKTDRFVPNSVSA
ncbi:Hypp4475 [Branchiostoma lanceolatum]|uniref:Hypp4475 protein n=1 Tax=Branchiostoma lanceolatum TaxID=7740 RepID=A0A8K0A7R8_BRALA|nr:Hypp4475 [Branchiostoma lanceolatum]